jgi:hypothetical protein
MHRYVSLLPAWVFPATGEVCGQNGEYYRCYSASGEFGVIGACVFCTSSSRLQDIRSCGLVKFQPAHFDVVHSGESRAPVLIAMQWWFRCAAADGNATHHAG